MKTLEFRTLRPNEIDCRIKQVTSYGVTILLYKDARVDQNLLDETVGAMNWQRKHSRDNANCTVSIWDDEKAQWIEKEDTGTESNTEAEKGLASDSFKRACFNWGIGRELYTAPKIRIDAANINFDKGAPSDKPKTYDTFEVALIEYDELKNITALAIRNKKTKKIVFEYGKPSAGQQAKPDPVKPAELPPSEAEGQKQIEEVKKAKIDETKLAALRAAMRNNGVSQGQILRAYRIKALEDITENQFAHITQHWEDLKKV